MQATTRTPPAPVKRQEPLAKRIVKFQADTEAMSHTGKKPVKGGITQKAGNSSRRKQRSNTQHVELPSVFTMQGISINTTCLQSLSYYDSDGIRVQSLTPPASSLSHADVYIDSATSGPHSPAQNSRLSSPASAAGTSDVPPQQHAASSSSSLSAKAAERTPDASSRQHAASSSTSVCEKAAQQHASMLTEFRPHEQVASTSYDNAVQHLHNSQLQQKNSHVTLKKKPDSSSPGSTGSSQSGATMFRKRRATSSSSTDREHCISEEGRGNSGKEHGISDPDCSHSDRGCSNSGRHCSYTRGDSNSSGRVCSASAVEHSNSGSIGGTVRHTRTTDCSACGRDCSTSGTVRITNDRHCSSVHTDCSTSGNVGSNSCRQHRSTGGDSISGTDCANSDREHSNNGICHLQTDRQCGSSGTDCRSGGGDHSNSGQGSSSDGLWPTACLHAAHAHSPRGTLSHTHSHTHSVRCTVREPQTHCRTQSGMSVAAQSPHAAAQHLQSLYAANAGSAMSDDHVMAEGTSAQNCQAAAQQSGGGRNTVDESLLANDQVMQAGMPGKDGCGDAHSAVSADSTASTRRKVSKNRSRKQAQHSSSCKAKQQNCTAQSGVPLAPSTGEHRQNTRQQLSDVTNCLGTALWGQGLAYMNADQDYSQNSNSDGFSADLYV